jgi:hypothetical protein
LLHACSAVAGLVADASGSEAILRHSITEENYAVVVMRGGGFSPSARIHTRNVRIASDSPLYETHLQIAPHHHHPWIRIVCPSRINDADLSGDDQHGLPQVSPTRKQP